MKTVGSKGLCRDGGPHQDRIHFKILATNLGLWHYPPWREESLSRIRHIEIRNFRCIREFSWWPSQGINCLVGPGDVGKSSILDAIDLCLGARRTIQFTDADFFNLDVGTPVSISVTIGELDDLLKNMEAYGNFLRSCSTVTRTIEDEPEKDGETVLTLRLTVSGDLARARLVARFRPRCGAVADSQSQLDGST
jgi:AAA ATPase domain